MTTQNSPSHRPKITSRHIRKPVTCAKTHVRGPWDSFAVPRSLIMPLTCGFAAVPRVPLIGVCVHGTPHTPLGAGVLGTPADVKTAREHQTARIAAPARGGLS